MKKSASEPGLRCANVFGARRSRVGSSRHKKNCRRKLLRSKSCHLQEKMLKFRQNAADEKREL